MPEFDDPVLLDTDVASDLLMGRIAPADGVLLGRTWCVSFVTVGELVKGAVAAGWGRRK